MFSIFKSHSPHVTFLETAKKKINKNALTKNIYMAWLWTGNMIAVNCAYCGSF